MDERRINRHPIHLGLTKSTLDVLEAVAELQPANVSDLAALLCISKQKPGQHGPRLRGLGFLARERN